MILMFNHTSINDWLYFGIPVTMFPYIPHSLFPLLILKNPWSPHPSFQELANSQ